MLFSIQAQLTEPALMISLDFGRTPGHIRLTGGQWRNTRLKVHNSKGLRPTPERLRETLFNWLAPTITGSHSLDLFAGTGGLGLEALSRGGASGIFVEIDRRLFGQLRQNIERLQANAELFCTDALVWLKHCQDKFDLVLIDPPFETGLLSPACELLDTRKLLKDRAMIYCEISSRTDLPKVPADWQLLRQSRAGATLGLLYQYRMQENHHD